LANFSDSGTGSSFLEFTALQHWQVRLLMYSSERLSTRATHIQCSSRSTSGLLRWSPKAPANPVRVATASGYVDLMIGRTELSWQGTKLDW